MDKNKLSLLSNITLGILKFMQTTGTSKGIKMYQDRTGRNLVEDLKKHGEDAYSKLSKNKDLASNFAILNVDAKNKIADKIIEKGEEEAKGYFDTICEELDKFVSDTIGKRL